MTKRLIDWMVRRSPRWAYLHNLPFRQFGVLLAGAFLLFTVSGFYEDLLDGGRMPYAVALTIGIVSGLNTVLWIVVAARLPMYCLLGMIALQFVLSTINRVIREWLEATWHLSPVPSGAGLHFAATSIAIVIVASFICFLRFMKMTGQEAMRMRSELELAQGIQKTLVPPVSPKTCCFEIYGISHPSEKVGGDLVDVVDLPCGDTVAYVADIAGHGLQAGILMGMLKTAIRTALADEDEVDGKAMLSQLMYRLNVVLPQVKEAHMYATFTSLRLNQDGESFYGMAASPPLLHWSAASRSITCIEEQQFPLGLLPVSEFPACRLPMESGDLVVIATDGILEVASETKSRRGAEHSVEFGAARLEKLVTDCAELPLHELAASVLSAARSYGRQLDDQTLLLVRRLTS
ncbi:PP2C family protein-serine/threonine phosphatase [Acidicapsa acidisoli]|uniref:PP2C family protein-serine/threonine phosphatase n=1 Tax=Acidicapsa acidisoli TaxID=1615681 RepID=UPI0021DFF67D|nr:PP2C family protein-serine/threonine phosphatase [Acidicapsa acidisoli]